LNEDRRAVVVSDRDELGDNGCEVLNGSAVVGDEGQASAFVERDMDAPVSEDGGSVERVAVVGLFGVALPGGDAVEEVVRIVGLRYRESIGATPEEPCTDKTSSSTVTRSRRYARSTGVSQSGSQDFLRRVTLAFV
jgi:hypothetical protein